MPTEKVDWTNKGYAKKEIETTLYLMKPKLSEYEYDTIKTASTVSYGYASNGVEYLSAMLNETPQVISNTTLSDKWKAYLKQAIVAAGSEAQYEEWWDDVVYFVEETKNDVVETAKVGGSSVIKIGIGAGVLYALFKVLK